MVTELCEQLIHSHGPVEDLCDHIRNHIAWYGNQWHNLTLTTCLVLDRTIDHKGFWEQPEVTFENPLNSRGGFKTKYKVDLHIPSKRRSAL